MNKPTTTPSTPNTTPAVLIIDDHRESADVLRRLLHNQGYVVATAFSFTEALEICRQRSFSLALCDIELNDLDGDGNALLPKLREHCHLKAIALSGRSNPEDLARAKHAGFDAYITKPIQFDPLLKTVQTLLG